MQPVATKHRLLLVDGDPKSLRVLDVSLKKVGFHVTSATNGFEALAAIEQEAPDLIISDTHMAEMDGFELCRRIKQRAEWAKIPFIFLSGHKSIEEKIRGLELGVEDYLSKPIYIKEIITRVKMLLQRQQRERLESRRVDPRTKFTGHLQDIGIVDLVQTIEVNRKSGIIHIINKDRRRGEVYFREGRVIDAEVGRLSGAEALYRLFFWSEGAFEVEFKPIRRKDVIELSTQALLMEGMRRLDEWTRLLETLPPLDAVFEVDYQVLAERLADIPDEVNGVLRLFDGRRSFLQVVEDSEFPDLEAASIVGRLLADKIIYEVHREPARPAAEPPASDNESRLERWLSEAPGASAGADDAEDQTLADEELPEDTNEVVAAGGEEFDGTPTEVDRITPPRTRPTPARGSEAVLRALPGGAVAGAEEGQTPGPLAGVTPSEAALSATPMVSGTAESVASGTRAQAAPPAPAAAVGSAPVASLPNVQDETGARAPELEDDAETPDEAAEPEPARPPATIVLTRRMTPPPVAAVAPARSTPTRSTPTPERALPVRVTGAAPAQPPEANAGTSDDGDESPFLNDEEIEQASRSKGRLAALMLVGLVLGGGAALAYIRSWGSGAPAETAAENPGGELPVPADERSPSAVARDPAAAAGAPAAVAPAAGGQAAGAPAAVAPAPGASAPAGAVPDSPGAAPAAGIPPVDLPGAPSRAPAAAAAMDPAVLAGCREAYASEKYAAIVEACGKALEAKPDATEVLVMLAHAELDKGNYAKSLSWARKALEVDPNIPEAYVFVGGAAQQMNRRVDAKAAYQKYLELAPEGKYADDVRVIVKGL